MTAAVGAIVVFAGDVDLFVTTVEADFTAFVGKWLVAWGIVVDAGKRLLGR